MPKKPRTPPHRAQATASETGGEERPKSGGSSVGWKIGLSLAGALAVVWLVWPSGAPKSPGLPSPGPGPGPGSEGSRSDVSAKAWVFGPDPDVWARYAGSESCKDCHGTQHGSWHGSNHGLAERPVDEALDRIAFEPGRSFSHGSQTTDVSWNDGRPTVRADGVAGKRDAMPVARVIGHEPLRQYLVEFPGGRLQTLEASWDPKLNEWFNVYGAEDRLPGEWGHWTGRGMNWNTMCGTCHNTRFRKHYDPGTDAYRSAMAEPTVGCEACHGPMRDHVSWQRAWTDSGKKDPTLVKRTPAEHMETCAPCHARRAELTGDFVPGESFWDHFLLSIVDETEVFYPDGQVREEDYEFTAFLGSRMHAAGVTCLDCHDSHKAQPLLDGNDLCLRCHNGSRQGSPIIDPVRHSFHRPGEAGSRCVDCHMPITVYMGRDPRHDHGFTTPDPKLTKEFGIPNACNRCHSDRDADWALAACETWYGPRMERPARARASLMARGRRGEPSARDGLLALLRSNETPSWKASSVALLARWVNDEPVRDALIGVLGHEHPMVRHRAVQALAPRVEGGDTAAASAVRGRLTDGSRGVRVASAWALRGQGHQEGAAGTELAHMLRLNADQPTGQAQLAVAALARGAMEEAISHYQRAVAWDPGSPALRQDLAVALSLSGRSREALEQTREAARIQPDVGENHYRLGLAWAEVGDLGQAVAALEEALRLDPSNDRAAYNLGLAYQQRGDSGRALTMLELAERANPRDARIPYARATVLMQSDLRAEAREAARRVLAIDPTHAGAGELIRILGR
ncbi:MAG: tetratricopeptide repeat protein [Limisphaerales bacterium]